MGQQPRLHTVHVLVVLFTDTENEDSRDTAVGPPAQHKRSKTMCGWSRQRGRAARRGKWGLTHRDDVEVKISSFQLSQVTFNHLNTVH